MKIKNFLILFLICLIVVNMTVTMASCDKSNNASSAVSGTVSEQLLSWEEFEALTSEEKEAFYESFDSADAFEKWMDEAQGKNTEPNPWEIDGAKKPSEYTWEEFQALTTAQQEAFFESFESTEAFEKWMDIAQEKDKEPNPWEVSGAKQPEEYTWEEFEALTPEQQEAFFESFESAEAFEEWMNRAKSK